MLANALVLVFWRGTAGTRGSSWRQDEADFVASCFGQDTIHHAIDKRGGCATPLQRYGWDLSVSLTRMLVVRSHILSSVDPRLDGTPCLCLASCLSCLSLRERASRIHYSNVVHGGSHCCVLAQTLCCLEKRQWLHDCICAAFADGWRS